MAKGQRSNRKKALRSARREKVSATWAAEAEERKAAALARDLASGKAPINPGGPSRRGDDEDGAAPMDLHQQQTERGEGAASMAVDRQPAGKKKKKGFALRGVKGKKVVGGKKRKGIQFVDAGGKKKRKRMR